MRICRFVCHDTVTHTLETLCRGKSDAVLRLQKSQHVLSESALVKTCWTSEGQELVRAALEEEERARTQMKDAYPAAREPEVTLAQHGTDHPAISIEIPSLECACDSQIIHPFADREWVGDASSIGGTCRAGVQVSWILKVKGLVPEFSYLLSFEWSLADELLGAFRSVISTTTSSCVVRKPLIQSGQNGTSTFDLIKHNRKLRMDVGVWDTYPGLTEEEARIGAIHTDQPVRVHCSGEQLEEEKADCLPRFEVGAVHMDCIYSKVGTVLIKWMPLSK